MGRRVHRGPQVWSDPRVNLERPGPWVTEDTLDPQDPLESRVYREARGRKAPRETQDRWGLLGKAVRPV